MHLTLLLIILLVGPFSQCVRLPDSQTPKLWTGPVESQVNRTEDVCECGVQKIMSTLRRHRHKRIIGGTEATRGEFPWQAHIKVSGSQCGGALINHNFIVTAAHCVRRAKLSDITVLLGEHNTKVNDKWGDPLRKESFTVIGKTMHPEFKYTKAQPFRYDVAVLKLDRRVRFKDNILPICFPVENGNYLGENGTVAGWGKTDSSKGKSKTNVLQSATLKIISNAECRRWYNTKNISVQLFDEMLCAGLKNGEMDTCWGDSGSPLVVHEIYKGKWTLAGITSSGFGCGLDHQPGIYHNVALSVKWIQRNIVS